MKEDEKPIEEFTDEDIENLLRDALKVRLEEKRKVPSKVRLNQALINSVGEFMTCFKILGYDYDGNPVNITAYKERIQKAALDNQFVDEIGRFMASKSE